MLNLKSLIPINKRTLVFPVDIFLMALSFFLAHLIRFESLQFLNRYENFFISLGIVVLSRGIVFIFSNIYRSIWAYASIHDLVEIIKTTLLSSLVSTISLLFYNRFEQMSRMVPILDTLILLSFLCFRSFSWRLFRDQYLGKIWLNEGKRTLFLGAGKLGVTIVQEVRRNRELKINPIGFLDDDPKKLGAHIQGIPILGSLKQADEIIQKFNIELVIITMSSPNGKLIKALIEKFEKTNVEFKILPSFSKFFKAPNFKQLREIQVEDLLGRPTVTLEKDSIQLYLTGKKILISGAGGSIGSEISRQILSFHPSEIILLDSAETALYQIDYELRNSVETSVKISSVIADVKNLSRLNSVFGKFRPDVVFHSAAYKHVPLMEINPSEAVLNNIFGTKNIADVSKLFGIKNFVLISTDKAVRPVNVMGATKRISELYIQFLSNQSKTKFTIVRFGNVLGSNGSVIPRFREQINKGGPVTVTHPDIIRYFMTIEEAAQLVLQAGSMGENGEIFLLEMGEPVKILNLAEEMIRLSGFVPYEEIQIQFTGLRPGEKLFEELLLNDENIQKTTHPKIRIAKVTEQLESFIFQERLKSLIQDAKDLNDEKILQEFKEIIPEYTIHKDYLFKISSKELH